MDRFLRERFCGKAVWHSGMGVRLDIESLSSETAEHDGFLSSSLGAEIELVKPE